MVAGRPRTVSFPPEEMEKLGQEMILWIMAHPDILHLSEWYTIEKYFTYNQWKAFLQCNDFLPYYEVALKMVGRKYLDKTSNIRDSISQRWQRVYFKDLKEEEDETKVFESGLKAKENQVVDEKHSKNFETFMSQLSTIQSALKIDDKIINAEQKS